jgi:gliding motility-associated-like protein
MNNLSVSNNNELYVYLINTGCSSDTVFLNFNSGLNPIIEFPDTITFCLGDDLIIDDPTQFANNYLWGNGSVNPNIIVNQQGWYTLLASSVLGCSTLDSVYVLALKCNINPAPNVFTPNEDGYNDVFKLYADGMTIISMQIFNRWGQMVYETNNVNEGWNGYFNSGAIAPEGTYYYVANAKYLNNEKQELKGSLTLIR